MMLRSWWFGVLVLGCAGVSDAAQAQPAPEGPPVPPATESAVSGRAAAGGGKGGAAVGGGSAAPSSDREPQEALRAFAPAPPPMDPGPPPQPTSALTTFAPAPAPPPGGGPKPAPGPAAVSGERAAPTSARDAAAASGEPTGGAPKPATVPDETAAYSGRGEERWSASALAGVGVTFDNTTAGVNPLGFGFGVRADYRVLPQLSLGARMLYFVGGSVELPTSDLAMQSWLLAAEGAYVIALDQLVIQPGIALGLHVREIDYRGFAGVVGGPEMLIPPDSTRLGLYVAPGVNFAVPLESASPSLAPLIVGADVRLDLAFGRSVTSNIQLLVLAGFQF